MLRSLVASAVWTTSPKIGNTGQTLVMLSSVPISCTLTDIRSLAYKPSNPYPTRSHSTPRDSSSTSLAASISSIEFQRTILLNPSGRVLVRFRDANRAIEFEETAKERILGGSKIKAKRVDSAPVSPHHLIRRLYEMQQQSPGRVVMLKGLPGHFSRGRMEKILSRNYALAKETKKFIDEDGNEGPLTAIFEIKDITGQSDNFATNFLVQLRTISSATMLVRRWHRSIWRSKEVERYKADDNENDATYEEDLADGEGPEAAAEDIKWMDKFNSRIDGKDEGSTRYTSARVIDAYLMH